jgi:hypothetical protein
MPAPHRSVWLAEARRGPVAEPHPPGAAVRRRSPGHPKPGKKWPCWPEERQSRTRRRGVT